MPKVIENRDALKLQILRLLSVDAKISVEKIARELKITKAASYALFLETVEEYGLKFVPEINVENIWRTEFIKLSKVHGRREMLDKVLDKIPELGFQEYIIFFKFLDKVPSDEKIIDAIGDSYMPQFVARLRGEYDLVMYAVSRSYFNINKFVIDFSTKLKNHKLRSIINKIGKTFGFFPFKNELIKQFNISETYKDLLLGLNENSREEMKEIAKNNKIQAEQLTYAMDRLKRLEILERLTYYETKPKTVVTAIIIVEILNEFAFLQKKNKWFFDIINSYKKMHNEYSFICDISNPEGAIIVANFSDNGRIEGFVESLNKNLSSINVKYISLTKVLWGNLGIRNFDMKHSLQNKLLEREGLVKKDLKEI